MAKERDELLNHDYDGIQEYNNPLPGWWQWLFYGTILFSVIYIPYYLAGYGLSSQEAYEQEMAAQPSRAEAPAAATPTPGTGGAESLEGNAEAIAAGREIFQGTCMPCHGAQGQGGIGPNLTDEYWLHGNSYPQIVGVITEGVPAKGMIAWKAALNPKKIAQTAAFVLSLQGSSPPNPKPPQGEIYPR